MDRAFAPESIQRPRRLAANRARRDAAIIGTFTASTYGWRTISPRGPMNRPADPRSFVNSRVPGCPSVRHKRIPRPTEEEIMRRFATSLTSHRKTVTFGWIVSLIVIGAIAGNKGANFSEEFKLPSSDSTEAYELLEDEFGGQSGSTATIVWKADEGVESPQVKKTMEGVFKSVEE